MKRIEAIIKTTKCKPVVEALKQIGVGGMTILDGRGQGAGARPLVAGLRGTARFIAEFNSQNSLFVIVDDSRVEQVISAITNAAGTGSKGDGKIFVTPVEEVVDIGSKKKGISAL